MSKGRLIAGILCLVAAAVLAVLTVTLEPGRVVFFVGDKSYPWVPVIVAGVVGLVLVATAGVGQTAAQEQRPAPVVDEDKATLNKRLETAGWGCFLILLGGFMFVPKSVIREGFWSIGIGLIMLGLNAARYRFGIRMSGFTTVLGLIALLGGILQLAGVQGIEGAFLLIILGAFLLLKPWFDKRRLFGKAEEP